MCEVALRKDRPGPCRVGLEPWQPDEDCPDYGTSERLLCVVCWRVSRYTDAVGHERAGWRFVHDGLAVCRDGHCRSEARAGFGPLRKRTAPPPPDCGR